MALSKDTDGILIEHEHASQKDLFTDELYNECRRFEFKGQTNISWVR